MFDFLLKMVDFVGLWAGGAKVGGVKMLMNFVFKK